MDAQGVEAAIMLPTLGVGVAHELRHDPPALFANLRAFNRWLEEDWGFGNRGRIYSLPMLSLVDIDLAVAELERVLAEGARSVNLTPGPVNGHSPADPLFDPFWARCQEAGIPVVFHLGNDGLAELYSAQWGENPTPPSHRLSPFQRVTASTERATADTLCALVFHNLFGRFPDLRVVSIENGAGWVGPLMREMDHVARLAGPRDWTYGHCPGRPSEIFKQHIKISPFPEENIPALVELLGPDNVLAGSDWPHPEGCAEPIDYLDGLDGLSPEVVRAVMRDNTAQLFRLA
jgi:predicted TIM-barrel fold metal-dependent hydrolase